MRVPFFIGGGKLNNRILMLLALLVFCCQMNVYAEGSSVKDTINTDVEPGKKDDKGLYISGTLIFWTDNIYGSEKRMIYGKKLYVVTNNKRNWISLRTDSDDAFYFDKYVIEDEKNPTIWTIRGGKCWFDKSTSADSSGLVGFITSLPVFNCDDTNFQENLKKYLEKGDCSGAENVYDVSQPTQDDSVELPKNLRTYGNVFEEAIEGTSISSMTPRYNAMTVRWDPPEDIQSYSYDVKIQVTYSKCTGVVTGRVPDLTKTETTSAEMVVTDYPYANRGTYDLTTGKEISRGDNQPEDYVINGDTLKKLNYSVDFNNMFPRTLKVWVRNRKGDKCSNWVAVSANASMPSGSDSKARVEDNNGNKVDNDTYNDTPVDNSKQNTYYETDKNGPNSSETPEFSLSKFLEYLKSGFGLMGSNGLVAFFARSFNYYPSQIWILITAGVACMIVVGIVNFALKR